MCGVCDDFASGFLQVIIIYICTINADFADYFLQLIELVTPTWPPLSVEGRERAQRWSSGTATAARPPGALPLLEPSSETVLGN